MEELGGASYDVLLPARSQRRCQLLHPRLFVAKTIFVWAASFAFVPLIDANEEGRISAVVYAVVLVALHVLFLIIYFWRVRFRELDPNWRSLVARVLGLVASVYLLYLVAGHLSTNLSTLSLELFGLCLVHTFILLLLTIRITSAHDRKLEPVEPYEEQQIQ